jgi:hypothetical protein
VSVEAGMPVSLANTVAAHGAMETFGKAWRVRRES